MKLKDVLDNLNENTDIFIKNSEGRVIYNSLDFMKYDINIVCKYYEIMVENFGEENVEISVEIFDIDPILCITLK